VTNTQFKSFTEPTPNGGLAVLLRKLDNGNYLRHWTTAAELTMRADHPVVNVNWYAAVAYCSGRKAPAV